MYSGSKPENAGSFKLKATTKDGRTTSIDIRYYGFENFEENTNCALLLNDGTVSCTTVTVNEAGDTLTGIKTSEVENLTNAIYFNSNDNAIKNITKIGDDFLKESYSSISSIDISAFNKINQIGTNFLLDKRSLTSIDLSIFSGVTQINDYFLHGCRTLTSIDLSPLSGVESIAYGFLWNCSGLVSLDLSPLSSVKSIGQYFLAGCSSLTSISMFKSNEITAIPDGFLSGCSSLTSLDLSTLSNVITIEANFLSNFYKLASIILPSFNTENTITINGNFLSNCYLLNSIDVGNNNFVNATIQYSPGNFQGAANSSKNSILGSGGKSFYDKFKSTYSGQSSQFPISN
jgi:hypothetical protein